MYYIVTQNRIEGFHRWPEARGKVSFLSDRHRHIFEIRATKFVKDHDRELEIITEERRISQYMESKYGTPCEFQNMSCEKIAEDLCQTLGFDNVTVLEDGISGGGYQKE